MRAMTMEINSRAETVNTGLNTTLNIDSQLRGSAGVTGHDGHER